MFGKGAGGGGGLRLIPGKALFLRRGAQTFCREEPSAGVGFAPHSRESLISPLRGANLLPGRGASGRVSLRLTPGKALFFRQEAQTFHPDKAPAAVRVCASFRCGFAPCTRESLIPPLRGANLLPGRATGGGGGLRLISRKALFFRREAQTFCREKPRRLCEFAPYTRESLILPSRGANFLPGRATGGGGGLRLIPGKALFFRRGAQTFCREKPPAAVRVCASHPGKPYSSVEGRKPFAGKSPRRR